MLAYHNEGINNSEIARWLEIDEGSVQYNLRKFETFGHMEIRSRLERPKKTTGLAQSDRNLVNTSRCNRWLIAPALRHQCNLLATIKRLFMNGHVFVFSIDVRVDHPALMRISLMPRHNELIKNSAANCWMDIYRVNSAEKDTCFISFISIKPQLKLDHISD